MESNFKTLEFIYQDMQIHFLINPTDNNVMINATEMAKAFDKRIHNFLKADHTQNFIKELENYYASLSPNGDSENEKSIVEKQNLFPPNGVNDYNKVPEMSGTLNAKILKTNTNLGTYMCEPLALKFAAWLEPKFELWIYQHIQETIFGNYKKHWEAHARQEMAKINMEAVKKEILSNPTPEKVAMYFEEERRYHYAKNEKTKAIQNQYKLFK